MSRFVGSAANKHILNAKSFCGWLSDGPFKVTRCVAQITSVSLNLTGKGESKTAQTMNKVDEVFGIADMSLQPIRCPLEYYKLLSGQTFFKTGKGALQNSKTTENQDDKEAEGFLIDGTTGKKIWRDPLDITTDLTILANRTVALPGFLHNVGATELKSHHLEGMGHALNAGWGVVNILGGISAVRDYAGAEADEKTQKMWGIAHAIIELVAWLTGLLKDVLGDVSPTAKLGLTIANAGAELINGIDFMTQAAVYAE